MSFDIIGTSLGLISALTMQPDQQSLSSAVIASSEAYAEWNAMGKEMAELEMQEKMNGGRSVPAGMMQERMAQQRRYLERSHIISTRQKVWIAQDEARTEELESLRGSLVIGNIKGLAPLVLMGCGVACFFIGLVCFVVDTQPTVVWATTVGAIVLGLSVLPVDALLHSRHARTKLKGPLQTLKRKMTSGSSNV